LVFERNAIHKKEREGVGVGVGVGDDEGPRKVVYVFACISCVFKLNTSA